MIDLFFWLEIIISFILIVLIFFAFIYVAMQFVEERISAITKFGQFLNYFNLLMSFLLLFADYGKFATIVSIVNNGMWFSVLHYGFPFVDIFQIDVIGGFLTTIAGHVAWMIVFLEVEIDGYIALSLYITLVWATPILILVSLATTEESSGENHPRPKNFLGGFITRQIKRIQSILPHSSSDKFD